MELEKTGNKTSKSSNTSKRKDPSGRVLLKGESYRESDNRYVYRWRPEKGMPQKSIYANDLNTLRKKEAEVKKHQYSGLSYSSHTLNQMFDRHMTLKSSLRSTTSTNYKYLWEKYVQSSLGMMQVKDIKYSHIKSFYDTLIDKKGLSVSSAEAVHNLIYSALQLAVRDDLIASNHADGVMRIVKEERHYNSRKKKALTFDEQSAFLNYVETNPTYRHWFPLLLTGFSTGLRASELCGLRWDDIDFEKSTISVNHQLVYCKQPDYSFAYTASDPKTPKSERTIYMFNELKKSLLELKEIQSLSHKKQPIVAGYTNFVFLNGADNLYNSSCINQALKRMVRDYNLKEESLAAKEKREAVRLPQFSCHTMRHSYTTRLFEADAPLLFMQESLGHTSSKITMDVYTDLMEDKAKEIHEEVEKKFKIRKKDSDNPPSPDSSDSSNHSDTQ